MVESREVCIVLLFVGIDSEHWVDLGGNLGGLGLKETRLFVVGQTLITILYLLQFTFHFIFVFFMFLSSRPRVSYLSLF
jgi:hypothetical protein